MDDPDEYFTEDLVLDQQALAALDQVEAAYFTQVNKRQRIGDGGWKPGPGFYSATYDEHGDDMPEISVRIDGTYGVLDGRDAAHNINGGRAVSNVPSRPRAAPQPRQVHVHPVSRPSSSITNRTSLSVRPVRSVPERSTSARPTPVARQSDSPLEHKVAQLESQFTTLQADLQEERRIKMAREGEVTILRQNMAKAAQEHSTHLSSLQALKEAEISKQIQVQKELKEEIERLKTQLTFKQAESEVSARKPPPSARSKRTRDVPMTPLKQRDYNDGDFSSFGYPQGTPRRAQSEFPFRDPLPTHNTRLSPNIKRTASNLPGFQNSFTTSTPVQPAIKLRKFRDDIVSQPPSSIRPQSQSSPAGSPPLARDDRINMIVDNDVLEISQNDANDHPSPVEGEMEFDMEDDYPLEIIDPVSRREPSEEFFSTLLTHKLRGSRTPTLHILLNTSLSSPASTSAFSKACDGVLNTIAHHISNKDFTAAMIDIAKSFLIMTSMLRPKESAASLIALLNLATSLMRCAPSFAIWVLSSEEVNTPSIVLALCDMIRQDLSPSNDKESGFRLVQELLYFFEALSLSPTDMLVPRFLPLVSTMEILEILLNTSYPSSLVTVSCGLLTRLATFAQLAQAFLSLSKIDASSLSNPQEPARPHLEQLCSYLIDTDQTDAALKLNILQLFSTLSLASQEALISLRSHPLLIPSIVIFIAHIATPMWEDESLAPSSDDTLQTIQVMNHSIILLHHLVLGAEHAFNLAQRLYNIPFRKFSNIFHQFMVTLGRLSYADTPDWIAPGLRLEFERTIELSRDLLESVVDGPEGDSIWTAFQPDTDEDLPTEAGDIEASMLNEIENS